MDEFSRISHILKKVKVSKANHPFLILSHKKLLIQASKTMRKFLKVVENKNIFKITSENDTRPGYIFLHDCCYPSAGQIKYGSGAQNIGIIPAKCST